MKTILIVIAGMADLPDPNTLRETPLVVAKTPALDLLARRGDVTTINPFGPESSVSHNGALLSILGYDTAKGVPSVEELMEFGLDHSSNPSSYESLKPFIIPGFSGHAVCVTTSAWVRGVAKSALLHPLDIYSPGSSDAEILETLALQATDSLQDNEFVLVYIDAPLKASLRGDFEGKVRDLENIDRHLVGPIADFVWRSELMINLAVTTDMVTPWHRRRPAVMSVPLILYFNNHDREGNPDQNFSEVEAMLAPKYLTEPSDLIRYLINFSVDNEEEE